MDAFSDTPLLTIFTPAYNRAHTLHRLYDSLCRQQEKCFEWIVVDDGSTDGTREYIESIAAEGNFRICYYYKSNGGKHTATNVGVEKANGRYFLCVDSDDALAENAVSILKKCIEEKRPEGIIAYKSVLPIGTISGPCFPVGIEYATAYELAAVYKSVGERTLVYRTDIIKSIRLPEPEGQRFFPEVYLSDRFDERHTWFVLRDVICECEYQGDGYSASFRDLMINNPVSMKWFYADRIDLAKGIRDRIWNAYHYIGYSLLAKSDEGKYRGNNGFVFLPAFPIGIVFWLYYYILKMWKSKNA